MRRITAEMSQWRLDTQTGASLTFERCKGGHFSTLEDYALRVVGTQSQDGTPTPESPVPIQCVKAGTKVQVKDANGTAVCEITVPCDLYEGDTWYPMTGRVELVKCALQLHGDLPWLKSSSYPGGYYIRWDSLRPKGRSGIFRCSHARLVTNLSQYVPGTCYADGSCNIRLFNGDTMPSVAAWNNYLSAQYAAGTPVTVVYTLATPATEQYDPQPIYAPQGTVIVEQTPVDLAVDLSATMLVRR